MNIKETLFALSSADGVGNIREASDLAYDLLKEYRKTEKSDTLTVIGYLKGESDYTLMLDAHIDQIAMIVTDIDDNGFLTVAKSGGIDIRALPSRRVTVHGKEKVAAVFCATPPHLSSGEKEYTDIADIKLDTALGAKAKEIISIGDYVTFSADPCELLGTRVSGRSFDDRAAVACLIEVAKRLKDKKLPLNVAFVLSDGEELGMRGIRPAAFKVDPNEAIAIDVSFGDGIGISEDECGKLGEGGMIGISPALDRKISQKLIKTAKDNNIPYQTEVMGERTGTNADMIAVSRQGVRTCTLSIPLRNMHTEVETLDIKDLDSVCELLCAYILSGGAMND
ncbi:MAG: M20/M25/M40 family metallo-hydrolase [Acutalibacteraceae bacterium]|nr:M20/M25/M40 family metallo-hydrolase [Acutalibacteraceae bacterium]